jgi:cyclopropane fatty-acyl-phospholipid synthase-like methyltransferase
MTQLEQAYKGVSTSNHWKVFWQDQTTPLFHYNEEKWYRSYAQEFNLILEMLQYQGGSVLEAGCGCGALFEYLNIDKQDYTGIDISETMLTLFKTRHPTINLACADAADYRSNREFALIYSNQVVQYFNPQKLNLYIKNSLAMLQPNGIILLGNVLWNKCQSQFYSNCYTKGDLSLNFSKGSVISYGKWLARRILGRDFLGYWYGPEDFLKYQNDQIKLYVFGSLFHPYRFSVVLKKVL